MNQKEETFRENRVYDKLRQPKNFKRKQESSLNEIRLKFNEMNKKKDHLKATNEFKANTLTKLKAKQSSNKFVGLTTVSWESSGGF